MVFIALLFITILCLVTWLAVRQGVCFLVIEWEGAFPLQKLWWGLCGGGSFWYLARKVILSSNHLFRVGSVWNRERQN